MCYFATDEQEKRRLENFASHYNRKENWTVLEVSNVFTIDFHDNVSMLLPYICWHASSDKDLYWL